MQIDDMFPMMDDAQMREALDKADDDPDENADDWRILMRAQRAQTLRNVAEWLKDMADRINANRSDAASYVTTLGTGAVCPAAGLTVASVDLNEWCEALMGAAEVQSGANIGAMIGARGCIYQTVAPAAGVPGEYLVAVAWQGFNSTAIPAIDCGEDQYGDETKRRVVALPLTIADLN